MRASPKRRGQEACPERPSLRVMIRQEAGRYPARSQSWSGSFTCWPASPLGVAQSRRGLPIRAGQRAPDSQKIGVLGSQLPVIALVPPLMFDVHEPNRAPGEEAGEARRSPPSATEDPEPPGPCVARVRGREPGAGGSTVLRRG